MSTGFESKLIDELFYFIFLINIYCFCVDCCWFNSQIGETIFIFGRRFLLLDCDPFTRKYYCNMLGLEQPPKMQFNTDNLKNGICQGISSGQTKSPCKITTSMEKKKEDVIRKIYNHPKKLRYLISMVAIHPENQDREFILEYSLSDGTIKINEIGKKNSGRRAGCFLASMLVPKKKISLDNCDEEIPIYYTPDDFFIGAQINIFNHRFNVIGADLFVLHYIEKNCEKFSPEFIDNIRNYFSQKNNNNNNDDEKKNDDKIRNNYVVGNNNNVVIEPVVHPYPQGQLPKGKICSQCNEINSDRRKITWADQVQVPCTLTTG